MMAERTLIVVSDFDLFKLNEEQREKLIAFLEDIPPYCCVVFLYDTVDYKPNRTMKKLYKAVTEHVQVVEFRPADNSDLVVWIARRFKALGKEIDRQTAEYLIFTCGGLMTGLVPEIAKIGAYAKGSNAEIDAAIAKMPDINAFLRQDVGEPQFVEQCMAQMRALADMDDGQQGDPQGNPQGGMPVPQQPNGVAPL